MNLKQLLLRAKTLEIDAETKTALIDLIERAYDGLVFEDKSEPLELRLQNETPIFTEVVERAVLSDNEAPNHILIEGDNLHALTCLAFTHERAVDVIYIDPPYNTGNKDFRYNDRYVDKEDGYRHSKWLSFMSKRLRIAKQLLKDTGVIFISIDDNEQAQLKLLCDGIFGQENFVASIIWQKKYSPQNDAKWFSIMHDNIIIYAKLKENWRPFQLNRNEAMNERYSNPDNDPRGVWKSSDFSRKALVESTIYEITLPSGRKVIPPKGRSWLVSFENYEKLISDNRIWFGTKGDSVPSVKRFITDVKDGVTPNSIWFYEEVGHNQEATQELKTILHNTKDNFETPKPVRLIDRILRLSTSATKPYLVLDFFAGSGTTLHAVMALNAEDGGSRECILVTDNENGIAEEVCYERCKRVIQGYTNAKGAQVAGLARNNLRYYRTGFVEK